MDSIWERWSWALPHIHFFFFQSEHLLAVLLLTAPSFLRDSSTSSLLPAVHTGLVHKFHWDVLAKVASDLHLAKPEINPCFLHQQADSLLLSHLGSPMYQLFIPSYGSPMSSIYFLMDVCFYVLSSFLSLWLSETKLLWAICTHLCVDVCFLFLCLRVCLGYMIAQICLTF